jgi:TonB family protein
MGSSQNNSAAHLENLRHRRIKRIKRQRAIEVGKPVDVSLKGMALNPVQKKELSGLQLHAHDDQKHQVATRSRVSVLVSLAFHAVAVFIAAFYVVRTATVDDEAVSVEFFQEILEKRDPPDRKPIVKSQPQPTRQPQALKTLKLKPVVNLPTADTKFVVPDDGLEGVPDPGPTDAGPGIDTSGLDRMRFGPVKPKFDTGNPEDLIRQKLDNSTLGNIEDTPDIGETADPAPADHDAFKAQEVTRRPRWRNQVEPKYPSAARRAQKEGKVVLLATIDVDGKAKDIEVKEDDVGFGCARAAIEALEASRFSPAKRGEESVPIRISIPYQFKLED